MILNKLNISLFITAVLIGVLTTFFIYLYFFYVLLLFIAAIVFVVIILFDIIYKRNNWKLGIRLMTFGLLAWAIPFSTHKILEFNDRHKTDLLVKNIYVYKKSNNEFPKDLKSLEIPSSSKHYNYIVNSSLTSFELYHRDIYGFPHRFDSKDSTWNFP
jgi:hypothetical protein